VNERLVTATAPLLPWNAEGLTLTGRRARVPGYLTVVVSLAVFCSCRVDRLDAATDAVW